LPGHSPRGARPCSRKRTATLHCCRTQNVMD